MSFKQRTQRSPLQHVQSEWRGNRMRIEGCVKNLSNVLKDVIKDEIFSKSLLNDLLRIEDILQKHNDLNAKLKGVNIRVTE